MQNCQPPLSFTLLKGGGIDVATSREGVRPRKRTLLRGIGWFLCLVLLLITAFLQGMAYQSAKLQEIHKQAVFNAYWKGHLAGTTGHLARMPK